MGKFAIECPHCGSINTASNFIFAKKIIQCGNCGEEINTRTTRMTSRKCPHCGNVYVYDQSKGQHSKCPGCGTVVDNFSADGQRSKLLTVNCPQCACACQLEVSEGQKTAKCPVCDCELDVAKEYAKSKLVSATGVSVIQYEGDNATFVWKHPIEDFNLGSQLVVHESQEAIFFLNGEALDTFGPGRHTLETENLPVLKKIYAIPTGAQTPFHAEVYFVNKTVHMGMKWGTDSRVRFIDPMTGIALDIGASGELNLQVSDSRKLLVKLVGTTAGLADKQLLSAGGEGTIARLSKHMDLSHAELDDGSSITSAYGYVEQSSSKAITALRGFFRAPLMTGVKSYLGSTIRDEQINILEIDSHLDRLSEALREKISPKFEEFGLTIPQFYITNVSLPEDDKNFKDIKALLSAKYIGVKKEEVEAEIAKAARERKLVQETTEAELKAVRAQGEAAALRTTGLAEAEVMHAKGYNQKDVLESEVQKAYAAGIGQMGSGGGNGGGGNGGIASDMIGALAQMKVAGMMFDKMEGGMFKTPSANEPQPAPAVEKWACECGETENVKGFCMNCGKPRPAPKKADGWTCPSCGTAGITSKFCPECGAKKPEPAAGWTCPECGTTDITSKFCPECGAKKPEPAAGWTCPECGTADIKSKCCPECGAKKPE